MTEAIFLEVQNECEDLKGKRRVSVSKVLNILGVSRSGYNAWMHRLPSNHQKRIQSVKERIKKIYDQSYQNYGAPKITKEIQKNGEKISERTVGKYMRELGIKAQYIRPYTITTKNSDLSCKLENILDEQFNPTLPNTVWCTDITYIWTNAGFIYLTSIMDLYSRRIIAWSLTETLQVSCVINTINKAKHNREMVNPVVIHSDRGSQYVSNEYKKATANMTTSYSKKAFPWDNACIESFHAIIKREWINRFKIKNYHQAYALVFEYIETFYNTVRIHSHCNYMSPDEFEMEYEKANKLDILIAI